MDVSTQIDATNFSSQPTAAAMGQAIPQNHFSPMVGQLRAHSLHPDYPRPSKFVRVLSVLHRGLASSHSRSIDALLPSVARPPPAPRVSVEQAHVQVLDVLARDTSRFALRPSDPAWAASLAAEINQCVNDSVPDSTLAKTPLHGKSGCATAINSTLSHGGQIAMTLTRTNEPVSASFSTRSSSKTTSAWSEPSQPQSPAVRLAI